MRLFKYLGPHLTDVLRTGTLRFSPPKALNDPFELKPHLSEFSRTERVSKEFDDVLDAQLAQIYAKVPEQLRGSISPEAFQNMVAKALPPAKLEALKLEAYRQMQALVPRVGDTMTRSFDESLGILCLTEDPTSLLMWAHYAASHQGFVVEFDPDSPFFNQRLGPHDDFRHLRQVVYQRERPHVVLTEMDSFSPFLTKGQDWSYEREWRMMRPLADASKVVKGEGPTAVHLFEFPRSMVLRVILGCRMMDPKRDEIRQILRPENGYGHVICAQAQIDEGRYRLNITEADQRGNSCAAIPRLPATAPR